MPRSPRREERPRIIDRQNRVALPPDVLRVLEAKAGDYVMFEVEQGTVRLRRVTWKPA